MNKKQTGIIILAVIIIVAGGFVYVLTQKNPAAPDTNEAGVAVSPYDFDANGCVGNAEDLAKLQTLCPSEGVACNVVGETDAIQAALKFAEASNQYPCQ